MKYIKSSITVNVRWIFMVSSKSLNSSSPVNFTREFNGCK